MSKGGDRQVIWQKLIIATSTETDAKESNELTAANA
jgi:hypothetical protein